MDQFHDLFGAKNVNKTRIPAAPPEIDDESDEEGLQVEKLQYKVIILGDGAVGKTSITHRFTSDEFQQSYLSTIGVDWFIKTVTLTGFLLKSKSFLFFLEIFEKNTKKQSLLKLHCKFGTLGANKLVPSC